MELITGLYQVSCTGPNRLVIGKLYSVTHTSIARVERSCPMEALKILTTSESPHPPKGMLSAQKHI